MIIIGADPGIDGALAALELPSRNMITIISMPALDLAKGKGTKREIAAPALVAACRDIPKAVTHCFLERVSSSPQMGAVSSFQFGRWYGYLELLAAASGWGLTYVTPQKWKKALSVPAEKDDAIARAGQLMPDYVEMWTVRRGFVTAKQASGRAESALIALYGAREFVTDQRAILPGLVA